MYVYSKVIKILRFGKFPYNLLIVFINSSKTFAIVKFEIRAAPINKAGNHTLSGNNLTELYVLNLLNYYRKIFC